MKKFVEPGIHGGGDFFPQDNKKCLILVTLHVKGDTCTDASCFLVLRSTMRGNNMELGMCEQIEVSRHKKDIEN